MSPAAATASDSSSERDPPSIFHAAEHDDVAEMAAAIRVGQTIRDIEDRTGFTPLHLAAIRGSCNFLRAALEIDAGAAWLHDRDQLVPYDHARARSDRVAMAHLHNAMYPEAAVPIPKSR